MEPPKFKFKGVKYILLTPETDSDLVHKTLLKMREDGVLPNRINYPYIKEIYKDFCENYKVCRVCNKVDLKENMKTTSAAWYCAEHIEECDKHRLQIKEKTEQTFLKKYGVRRPAMNPEFIQKSEETQIKKYGTLACRTKEYREKHKNTIKEKYGVENISQIEEVKNLKKQKSLEKYGTEYVLQSPIIREQIKQTCLEKYGYEHSFQAPEVREQIKQTCLERYGYEYNLQDPEIRKQIKQTCLEKYGDENYNNREKAKQTCLERYGVEYPSQFEESKEKIKQTKLEKYGDENYFNIDKFKQTCLERYGVENVFQSEEIKEKIKETNLEKYGVEYYQQTPEFADRLKQTKLEKYGDENYVNVEKAKQTKLEKYGDENYVNVDKFKQTCLERYGKPYPVLSPEKMINLKEKYKKTNLERYGVVFSAQTHIKNYENYNEEYIRKNFIKDGYFLKDEFMEYFGVSYTTNLNNKSKYNIIEPSKNVWCKSQSKLFDLININNKLLNDRSLGFELDIYLPDYQLAIEYNGLMFHSQGISEYSIFNTPNFDKNYHLNKTLKCKDFNIQLFHIFEGEDIDLWLSMINNKLGLNSKIFARKCIIKELNYNEVKDFLDNNHLQKSCVSNINIGLFYNNELVQVMTFSKPRFNNNYEYELIRLCSLKNTNVVGGASKLLSYFIKKYKPKNIISYANRRFSNGTIYEKLGFTLVGISNPNYFYFKTGSLDLESRNKYQKHKLSKLLDNYDETLSEVQNMFNNDYRRIFDCGNLVYEMKLSH